jgi:hypothetical protein
VIYGLHEELPVAQCLRLGVCVAAASLKGAATSDGVQPLAQCLRLGVCVAAASLKGAATSDGVQPLAQCLALGETYGYRSSSQRVQGGI